MGIYIKGEEKPSNCFDCWIRQAKVDHCPVFSVYTCVRSEDGSYIRLNDYKDKCHPQCPVKVVKEPHGRLKDVDNAIMQVRQKICRFCSDFGARNCTDVVGDNDCQIGGCQIHSFITELCYAPTVIEKE